ncbi:hypothetical protein HDU93_007826 [Gonapodya sp. JEL0774]|nr:hypothetical protein HDU93_007826 [Gonapodya sp. JEL0774]
MSKQHSLPPPPPANLRPSTHVPPITAPLQEGRRSGDSYRPDSDTRVPDQDKPQSVSDQRENRSWSADRRISATRAGDSDTRRPAPASPPESRDFTPATRRAHSDSRGSERFSNAKPSQVSNRNVDAPRGRMDPSRHYEPADSVQPQRTEISLIGAARRERERLQAVTPTASEQSAPSASGMSAAPVASMEPPPARERKPLPPQSQIFTSAKSGSLGPSGGDGWRPNQSNVGPHGARRGSSPVQTTLENSERPKAPAGRPSILDRLGPRPVVPFANVDERGDRKRLRASSPPTAGRIAPHDDKPPDKRPRLAGDSLSERNDRLEHRASEGLDDRGLSSRWTPDSRRRDEVEDRLGFRRLSNSLADQDSRIATQRSFGDTGRRPEQSGVSKQEQGIRETNSAGDRRSLSDSRVVFRESAPHERETRERSSHIETGAAPSDVQRKSTDVMSRTSIDVSSVAKRDHKASLPPTWRAATTNDGRTYYWNIDTKETSWDVPTLIPGSLPRTDERENGETQRGAHRDGPPSSLQSSYAEPSKPGSSTRSLTERIADRRDGESSPRRMGTPVQRDRWDVGRKEDGEITYSPPRRGNDFRRQDEDFSRQEDDFRRREEVIRRQEDDLRRRDYDRRYPPAGREVIEPGWQPLRDRIEAGSRFTQSHSQPMGLTPPRRAPMMGPPPQLGPWGGRGVRLPALDSRPPMPQPPPPLPPPPPHRMGPIARENWERHRMDWERWDREVAMRSGSMGMRPLPDGGPLIGTGPGQREFGGRDWRSAPTQVRGSRRDTVVNGEAFRPPPRDFPIIRDYKDQRRYRGRLVREDVQIQAGAGSVQRDRGPTQRVENERSGSAQTADGELEQKQEDEADNDRLLELDPRELLLSEVAASHVEIPAQTAVSRITELTRFMYDGATGAKDLKKAARQLAATLDRRTLLGTVPKAGSLGIVVSTSREMARRRELSGAVKAKKLDFMQSSWRAHLRDPIPLVPKVPKEPMDRLKASVHAELAKTFEPINGGVTTHIRIPSRGTGSIVVETLEGMAHKIRATALVTDSEGGTATGTRDIFNA